MAKRISITLTDTQEQALDALAAESGASLQSMVGLAVSAWLRGQQPQEPAEDYESQHRDERPPYQRYELLAFLGVSAEDFDIDAIERDATAYDPRTGRTVWAVDHDELAEICARHDRSIRRSTVQVAREVVTRPQHAESHDEDEGGPLCEVCGRPAVWFSEDEDGTTHYTCDEH